MQTILRRILLGVLICGAATAVVWRFTWGTDRALSARAESRLDKGSAELSMQAERDEANGTGSHSYDTVTNLVTICRKKIRDEVGQFPFIAVDADIPLAEAFIYTYTYRGNRYVGVAPRNSLAGTSAATEEQLMPPLAGRYIVSGNVAYSTAPIQSSNYQHRTYYCVANVKGVNVRVESVSLRLVQ